MKDCLFCQRDKIKDDILLESENFFVKVGVGILAPGHVMVITKGHISCFAELPKQIMKEFISLKNKVTENLKLNFTNPIIYEHGIYGQSIKHAHLHFLPRKNEYFDLSNIREVLFNGLKSTSIVNMEQLAYIHAKEGSYFYLEIDGDRMVYHTKDKEAGKYIFRKEFARLTGLTGLENWKSMTENDKQRDREWIDITKKTFQ